MKIISSALANVDIAMSPTVEANLALLPGVAAIPLPDRSSVGLLIETDTLDEAYNLLHHQIPGLAGVISVRPVYAYFGPDLSEQ
ncbi:MAG: hypothetical protein AB1801_04030 [Chloroflexota bacterium]